MTKCFTQHLTKSAEMSQVASKIKQKMTFMNGG